MDMVMVRIRVKVRGRVMCRVRQCAELGVGVELGSCN